MLDESYYEEVKKTTVFFKHFYILKTMVSFTFLSKETHKNIKVNLCKGKVDYLATTINSDNNSCKIKL